MFLNVNTINKYKQFCLVTKVESQMLYNVTPSKWSEYVTSHSSKALANDYDLQATYSNSSATKTYTVESLQTYSPIPVSQACSTPANLSAKYWIGKFFFAEYLSMSGTDPRSTQKTNVKGHPNSPLSSNTCKHPLFIHRPTQLIPS